MSLQQTFSAEIEAFLTANCMDAATFGRRALKDPNFVFDLRDGRCPNLRTIERVRDFMKLIAGGKKPSRRRAAA